MRSNARDQGRAGDDPRQVRRREPQKQHLADYSANGSGRSTAALGFDRPGHGFGFFKDADSHVAPPPYPGTAVGASDETLICRMVWDDESIAATLTAPEGAGVRVRLDRLRHDTASILVSRTTAGEEWLNGDQSILKTASVKGKSGDAECRVRQCFRGHKHHGPARLVWVLVILIYVGESAMGDQPNILFVDDEDSIRLTLPPLLQSYGFEVTSAATVAEALA